MPPVIRPLLRPKSTPRLVCSAVSHFKLAFPTCTAANPLVTVPPNGYSEPLSDLGSSWGWYGATAGLPGLPQPARRVSDEMPSGFPLMNPSSLRRHDPERAGNTSH